MIQKSGMCFIYALQHNVTKKIYIGKSENLYTRYQFHMKALKEQKHSSHELQSAFNKYGEDFSLYILEEIEYPNERILYYGEPVRKDRIAEVKWMEIYDTLENGYNKQDKSSKRLILKRREAIPLKEGKPTLPEKERRAEDDRKCSDQGSGRDFGQE